jgi:hypothetical protein
MYTNHRILRTKSPRFSLTAALSHINGPLVAALIINGFIWGALIALWYLAQKP